MIHMSDRRRVDEKDEVDEGSKDVSNGGVSRKTRFEGVDDGDDVGENVE